jgi:hypothetical protein
LDIGGVKEMYEFKDTPMKSQEKTMIQKLQSLPDKQRAIILLGILIDPSSAANVLRMDERISQLAEQIIEELLAMDREVRLPLVVTYLKDSFLSLDSMRGLNGTG